MRLIGPPILRECLKPQPHHPTVKPHIPPTETQPLTAPQNPCTHLFFGLNPETQPETLTQLIKQSWKYDPLTTLKLICYSRTLRVRGDSLSCNEGFYVAAIWLHKNHPLTLACNMRQFAGFGSLRDFSDILYRLVHDSNDDDDDHHHHHSNHHHHDETEKMVIARNAVCKYAKDSTYRFLHDRVSDIFADLLRSDYETLNNGNDVESLSFAARECPSIDSSCDRHTLLCESIAKKVFPRDSDPCYTDLEDEHYVYRVRSRLRKEVLRPLRSALEKEETQRKLSDSTFFMKKAYQKMLKMKENAPSRQRYYRILLSTILKANDQNLPSTPPCVIASLIEENKGMKELEWQNMVKTFSSNRKLRNSVAVCDILDGMKENTRNVSISMGLLISELSNELWNGTIYAFHESPKLCKIEGDDLQSKVNFMKQIKCTESVNIETVLDQVLQVGVSQKLEKEKMVERVFVFTNKEFRKAVDNCWGWNYRAVWENYKKFGYDQVPEVVFWNVEGFIDRPPTIRTAIHNTMVIINGFSRGLFTFFLDENALLGSEEIRSITTAEDVMRITLSGKEFQNFAVLD